MLLASRFTNSFCISLLIGLAFDRNKESLASDAVYIPEYNRCVCVDIRFIIWALDKYAGMDRIIAELGL